MRQDKNFNVINARERAVKINAKRVSFLGTNKVYFSFFFNLLLNIGIETETE